MYPSLSKTAAAAALLLTLLCAITAFGGVSQQAFEIVSPPTDYARSLLASSAKLRLLIAIDDLFIAAYVAMTIMLATHLGRDAMTPLHWFALASGVAAGVLDLAENHHLLTMLRWAELSQPISEAEILHRSSFSQLKWMLGHTAFVAVGILLPKTREPIRRAFRTSLIFVQLPIGAATWAVTHPDWLLVLTWSRYGAFVSGFALTAWIARAGFDGPARDVRA